MKTVIKVSNIRSQKDVANIRSELSDKEGIMACYIKKENGEIEVVYDKYFIDIQVMNGVLEDMGYTII